MPPSSEPPDRGANLRRMGLLLGLGTQLAAAVAGFGLLGYWIDTKAGTGSRWTTILLFVGAVGGMISFIRTVTHLPPQDRKPDAPHGHDTH